MAHIPFHGAVPDGLLYDTDHDVVRCDGDEVLIGITAFGIFLAGEIIAFTAKPRGATLHADAGWAPWKAARPCSPCIRRFHSRCSR